LALSYLFEDRLLIANSEHHPGNAVASARALGQEVRVLDASTAQEIEAAFATSVQQRMARSSLAGIRFSIASAIDSSRSRRAIRFRRF
jgi:hypothetical protein